ncbi:hypothetical protein Glove_156g83 [Diversispora epigaea]|uniref:Uncharacterized protein n=1 Tax=Diversispora epigaea TaxID=1348612 RepID=A0A397IS27_9GLOM|nr:hypothetical protein Glove_156g83 [Diversispora epigaea]
MKINFWKLQKKLPLKLRDRKLEVKETTEEESKEWEEEKRSSKRRKTFGGHLVSSRLTSPRVGSPRLFESLDTPDTTREKDDTTGGDTEGAKIVGQ